MDKQVVCIRTALDDKPARNTKFYNMTGKTKYPNKNEVIMQAVMARSLDQIIGLYKTLAQLRRVPPGTIKTIKHWYDGVQHTDEAGILMRVAQTSLVTNADVIPNINGTYTYIINSGIQFKSVHNIMEHRIFITNLEIIIRIPYDEEVDVHVFETNCSVLTKWDTCFKFSKVGDGTYSVKLPGFHAIDKQCINQLKIIFTANAPKHLPINILLQYDYVLLNFKVSSTVYDIVKRVTYHRINGSLAIKMIPFEQNTRPEYIMVNTLTKNARETMICINPKDVDAYFGTRTDPEDYYSTNKLLHPNIRPDFNILSSSYMALPDYISKTNKIILNCLLKNDYKNVNISQLSNYITQYRLRYILDMSRRVSKLYQLPGEKILISELKVYIIKTFNNYIDTYEKGIGKEQGRQRINTYFKSVSDNSLNVAFSAKKITFLALKINIIKQILFERNDIRKVTLIKGSHLGWDLDQFDIVFSDDMNDDFGDNDFVN